MRLILLLLITISFVVSCAENDKGTESKLTEKTIEKPVKAEQEIVKEKIRPVPTNKESTKSKEGVNTENWHEFKDVRNKFSFKFPRDLDILDVKDKLLIFARQNGSEQDLIHLSFYSFDLEEGQTDKDFIAQILKKHQENPSYKLVEQNRFEYLAAGVNGRVYKTMIQQKGSYIKLYSFLGDKEAYVFSFKAPKKRYKLLVSYIIRMLDTLKLNTK